MINNKLLITSKIVLLVSVILLFFKPNIDAQTVEAKFDYASFYKPKTETFIETYISMNSNSLHYKLTSDNLLEASVEVIMLFKNVDKIIEFRRFNIVSPQYADTTSSFPDFVDLQRITIPNGVYNFDLIIRDNNAPNPIANYYHSQLITVNIPNGEMSFSGVELIKKHTEVTYDNIYVKKGYESIPHISNFYPKNANKLKFYTELYFAAKEIGPLEDFMITSHIECSNTSKPISRFSTYEHQKAYNVNTIYNEINIADLPSGNYYLVVEVKDMDSNTLLSVKKSFQRENTIPYNKSINITNVAIANTFVTQLVNRDSLAFYISALNPICDSSEINFIDNVLQSANITLMQQFFLNFWIERGHNEPEQAWLEYKAKLSIVDKYKTEGVSGFNTCRGRVFLQYGSPSSIIDDNIDEVSNDYEIWYYYKIADQTNKKFVFVRQGSNGYKLVHSDMIGEIQNNNWKNELKRVE